MDRPKRQEQTVNGLATYHEATFRTYEPMWACNGAQDVLQQLSEEHAGGRWEPFIAEMGTRACEHVTA